MRYLKYFTGTLLAVLILSGCATVGVFQAKTLDQKIAAMIWAVDDTYATAIQARKAGAIDDDMAVKINPLLSAAHTAAHAASAFIGTGDAQSAEAQLKIADDLLWQIKALLPKETRHHERNRTGKPDHYADIGRHQIPGDSTGVAAARAYERWQGATGRDRRETRGAGRAQSRMGVVAAFRSIACA